MPKPGTRRLSMTDELRCKIAAYRTAMSIIRGMVSSCVLSENEYAQIDTIMTEKYGLNSCSIFRNNGGYVTGSEVICHTDKGVSQ
jgi:hypothetical protein